MRTFEHDYALFHILFTGNLNRHKKVKHGLNETTDVMEEDAVNFLSSLSERARDDHAVDGEGNSLSGEEDLDGKLGRKGRKSIPRKITQEEGEEQSGFAGSGEGPEGVGQDAGPTKPFVIQNPDTDEEGDDDEHPGVDKTGARQNDVPPTASTMMNFQPLHANPEIHSDGSYLRKRLPEDDARDLMPEKRPRRQSQRRSPKVHPDDVDENSEEDAEIDAIDNADDDWVPGSKRRSKSRSDDRVKIT